MLLLIRIIYQTLHNIIDNVNSILSVKDARRTRSIPQFFVYREIVTAQRTNFFVHIMNNFSVLDTLTHKQDQNQR